MLKLYQTNHDLAPCAPAAAGRANLLLMVVDLKKHRKRSASRVSDFDDCLFISLSTSKDLDRFLKKLQLKDQKVGLSQTHNEFLRSKLAGNDACPADLIFRTCVINNNLEYLKQILPKDGIYKFICVDRGIYELEDHLTQLISAVDLNASFEVLLRLLMTSESEKVS